MREKRLLSFRHLVKLVGFTIDELGMLSLILCESCVSSEGNRTGGISYQVYVDNNKMNAKRVLVVKPFLFFFSSFF